MKKRLFHFVPLGILLMIDSLNSCHGINLNYQWNASVNDKTGLATSFEQSSISISTATNDVSSSSIPPTSKKISEIFCNYPTFVCKNSLTFGLLKRKKCIQNIKNINSSSNGYNHDKKQARIMEGASDLLLPFVNIPILTFGQPTSTSFTRRSGHNHNVEVITEIPILGGILACNENCNHHDNVGEKQYNGRLQFKYNYSLEQGKDVDTLNNGVMETRIIEYRPAIAGCCAPLNKHRITVYLSLQSRFHAYVMNRFHRHCQKLIMCTN